MNLVYRGCAHVFHFRDSVEVRVHVSAMLSNAICNIWSIFSVLFNLAVILSSKVLSLKQFLKYTLFKSTNRMLNVLIFFFFFAYVHKEQKQHLVYEL